MHTEHHDEVRHHRNRHLAERFEGMLGVLMLVAIAVLAVGLVFGIMTTDSTPTWMR
jgi:cell division protein FtsL